MIFKLSQPQALGDIIVFSSTIRDIHDTFPDSKIVLNVSHPDVFVNNPYVTMESGKGFFQCFYKSEQSKEGISFCHEMHKCVEEHYNININRGEPRPWLFPSTKPRNSSLIELSDYVIIDAGYKTDMTAKHWGHINYQSVVNMCEDIKFVQIGRTTDRHKPLVGNNVINMLGRSDAHDLIWLINKALCVITPVSSPLNIAGAFGTPCICLAGGREPAYRYQYDNLYWFCANDKVCLRNCVRNDCRWYTVLGQDMVADCMSIITPEQISEKLKEIISNGNHRINDRQIIDMQYTTVASGRHSKGQEVIRCGEVICGGQGINSQQSEKRLDRRNRCRASKLNKEWEDTTGTKGQAVLVARPVGKRGLPREVSEDIAMIHGPKPITVSWKRRKGNIEKTETVIGIETPKNPSIKVNHLLVGALTSLPDGDFLGDTITQCISSSIYADAVKPERTSLLLKKGNKLNFLWDGFIRQNKAKVFEYEVKDIVRKYNILDKLRKDRVISEDKFDCYFEPWRCMDRLTRGHRVKDDGCPIIDMYLRGQEKPISTYWSFNHHYFDVSKYSKGNNKVLFSPLEKCQNNVIFTYPFYREVIKILLDKKISVVLNEKSAFCKDINSEYLSISYLPFNELMSQIAESSLVITGNSGLLWASAITNTPCIVCEDRNNMSMDMYSVCKNRFSHIRYIQERPIVEEIVAKIIRIVSL
jgi:ADP-heptose:LPS heptosyltransferase